MPKGKDYCDKDLTAALKEMGYPTKMTFIGEQATIEIPINSGLIDLYDAQKFLREEKKIHIVILYHSSVAWYEYMVEKADKLLASGNMFPSYEEALSTAIYMAIKLLKEEK